MAILLGQIRRFGRLSPAMLSKFVCLTSRSSILALTAAFVVIFAGGLILKHEMHHEKISLEVNRVFPQ